VIVQLRPKQKVLAKLSLAKLNSCLDQNFCVQLWPFAKTFVLAKLDLTLWLFVTVSNAWLCVIQWWMLLLTLVGIQCYQLESVCRIRKYLSFVELGLSFLTSRVIFVSGWSELVKAQVIPLCLSLLSGVLFILIDRSSVHIYNRHNHALVHGVYRIQFFEIQPEPDMVGYPSAYWARTGTGTWQCDSCSIALHADDAWSCINLCINC